MNRYIAMRAVTLAALLGCFAGATAEAQSGLLRAAQQKAKEKLQNSGGAPAAEPRAATPAAAAAPEAAPAARPASRSAMDEAMLDRFGRALAAEIGTRDQWVTLEQKFNQCQGGMYMNEATQAEIVRLTERFSSEMEKAKTTDDIILAGQNQQAAMDALVLKHCGITQREFVERQGRVSDDALAAALAAGGFSEREYGMLKERVVPFCKAGGRSERVPGSGKDKFYVYSAEEVAALAPRCGALLPQVERTL